MKLSVKALLVFGFVFMVSTEANACYVGASVRCCHPSIGCDSVTPSFNVKLNALLSSAHSLDEENEILENITLVIPNPAETPPPPVIHQRDPENPNPGACSSFHIHC